MRLRAHHLLCLLNYVGKGYSPVFVANYDDVVARLLIGADVEIVEGADDICAPLACARQGEGVGAHCFKASVRNRDVLAFGLVQRVLRGSGELPDVTGRWRLGQARVAALREAYRTGVFRAACRGCQWVRLCHRVSQSDYSQCRLRF